MQGAASMEVLVAVKQAEVDLLRQKLAQMSSDFSRNLAVMAVKDAEAEDAGTAVASLTVVLAEKDALFAQYEEQAAALEALRQKEAAECKALQAALDSQRQAWQQQLQAEQSKREALEQQLKQTEAASTEQLQSARQAAITQAVLHSNQYQADLERAAGQRKQLQQQVQELQAALAAKDSELAAVQMQLAAALESAKRVQENHGKSMASKSALVTQMELELQQVKGAHSTANKAHEGHIAQLIASINEMQELCTKQADELQQYAAGHKALQEERRGLQAAAKQHEEACSKAETGRSSMESALQQEVTAHAAIKAHQGLPQECLVSLVTDLQQQHEGAAASVTQLSAQLSQQQEQMVCAAVSSQQASPLKTQAARVLEEQYQGLSAQLLAAQERKACLRAVCTQMHSQVLPMLHPASPGKQATLAAWSPVKPTAAVTTSVQPHLSCMAALTQSLRQQQQQQQQQQQEQQQLQQERLGQVQEQHASTQQQCAVGYQQQLQDKQQAAPPLQYTGHQQPYALQSPQQAPQGCGCCQHERPASPGYGHQQLPAAAASPVVPQRHAGEGCMHTEPASDAAAPYTWRTPSKQTQQQQHPWQQPLAAQGHSPGAYSPSTWCAPAAVAATTASPVTALPASVAGMVSQLQAGVAQLQQQLCVSQQRLQPCRSPGWNRTAADNTAAAHSTTLYGASASSQQVPRVPHTAYQPGWQQQVLPPPQAPQCCPQGRPAGRHCAVSTPRQYSLEQGFADVPIQHGSQLLQQQQQQQQWQQRWDAGLDDFDSTCGKTSDGASSEAGSTLSCSAEVAAALAAARQRLAQRSLTPPSSKHRPKAGPPPRRVSEGPASQRRGIHAQAHAGKGGRAAAARRSTDSASLAALANATLAKLERLSTESPPTAKQWR